MARKIRNYTDEFKKQIIALKKNGKSTSNLAKEYDIAKFSILKWLKEYNSTGSFKAKDNRTTEENELLLLPRLNIALILNTFKVQQEYPIILSTTFSSRSSLSTKAEFDYLIMDEASQVDVTTGALALSCAKNVVIVGDTKQLPNVIKEPVKDIVRPIFDRFQISNGYNYTENSFLQSICKVIPDIPKTLLREHYRCHPKLLIFAIKSFITIT